MPAPREKKTEEETLKDKEEEKKHLLSLIDPELYKLANPKLNLHQEAFCQLYARHQEFFGDGLETYIKVYRPNQNNPGWYNVASVSVHRMLKNIKILDRINQIMVNTGFNDAHIDKQLSFIVTQNSDFSSKLGAIKEYNKLKQRIQDKIDLTSKGKQIGQTVIKIVKYGNTEKGE